MGKPGLLNATFLCESMYMYLCLCECMFLCVCRGPERPEENAVLLRAGVSGIHKPFNRRVVIYKFGPQDWAASTPNC